MVRPTPLLMVAVMMTASAYPAAGQEAPLAPKTTIVTVKVPIGDLDLSQDAGAETLLERASMAANRACGGLPGFGVLVMVETRAFHECRAKALSQAVASLDSPLVSQRFAQGRDAQVVQLAQAR